MIVLERLLAGLCSDMPVQDITFDEALVAPGIVAGMWPFVFVDSVMTL